MIRKNYNTLRIHDLKTESFAQKDFVEAMRALFTGSKSGHMEQWEYGSSQYKMDLAGGSAFWEAFMKSPRSYYLAEGERDLIKNITQSKLFKLFNDFKTIVEFGPGCHVSIANKTIPFMNACPNLESYVAVDSEPTQAQGAIDFIGKNTRIRNLSALHQDFEKIILNFPRLEPTAIIMWGCTFGNIAGSIGDDPYSSLLQSLTHYRETIAAGDFVFITFDTQDDEKAILEAYNQPLLSSCFLSTLHRLVRDNLVSGAFNPHQWRHESVWVADMMQCAHTIYPTVEQNFVLNGVEINVPANQRFVTNNSYKFKPEVMMAAAHEAGFDPRVIQHGPMAMLIAEKR